MSRVRLKDIAAKAGVSMMTVSRVMNNHPKVGKTTRENVLRIAQELEYAPNIAARDLAGAQSGLVGIVCDHANTSYVSQFLIGALRGCRARGVHMLIEETGGKHNDAAGLFSELISRHQVTGWVLLPPVSNDEGLLKYLIRHDVRFIRVGPDRQLDLSPYVGIDDYRAAYEITTMLINRGHNRIAHIKGATDQGASQSRYLGYRNALIANGHSPNSDYVEQGDFNYKSGMEAAARLLNLRVAPDAIFAANDDMAAGVIAQAHKRQLEIPADLSVVGFDDSEFATSVWPSLTTVQQPVNEMAQWAIEMLFSSQSPAKKNAVKHMVMDFTIHQRESSR